MGVMLDWCPSKLAQVALTLALFIFSASPLEDHRLPVQNLFQVYTGFPRQVLGLFFSEGFSLTP